MAQSPGYGAGFRRQLTGTTLTRHQATGQHHVAGWGYPITHIGHYFTQYGHLGPAGAEVLKPAACTSMISISKVRVLPAIRWLVPTSANLRPTLATITWRRPCKESVQSLCIPNHRSTVRSQRAQTDPPETTQKPFPHTRPASSEPNRAGA